MTVDEDVGERNASYIEGNRHVAAGEVEAAVAAYRAAAEAGHNRARVELARMLLHGIGVPDDPGAAIAWLERAEQAGNAVAGYLLALIAVGGRLVPRDGRINQRVSLAVSAGFPPAMLAAAIHFGRRPGARDQALCIELLQRAALAGNDTAAQLLCARLRRGEGCARDESGADEIQGQLSERGIGPLPDCSAGTPLQPTAVENRLALQDAWYAPPVEELAQRPKLAAIPALLSADECRLLMATSSPRLRQSHTLHPDDASKLYTGIRTSSDASYDPLQEDLALRLVQARMASAAGAELVHAEQLIVLRYAPGEQYHPHRDYLPPSAIEQDPRNAGDRAATICVYLNEVEAGGATEFPSAGLRIEPQAGKAIAFSNLLGDGRPDPDSLHAGLPVERGEKWLATLWLRQRPYRTY